MTDEKRRADDLGDDEAAGKGLGGFVPDAVKRALLTGMGALFMTEEGIRNFVGEVKLPKDAVNFLLSQAEKTRGEVTRVITQEFRRFLESETLRRELLKIMSSMTLEVKASIKLKPSGEPEVSGKVRVRRDAEDEEAPGEPAKS